MNLRNNLFAILIVWAIITFTSCCYSFKGISIPEEVNTFYVENFVNRVPDAPLNIEATFSEALRAKIRNESRLKYDENSPDVEFKGAITSYSISFEAPTAGNTAALNKLSITVQVEYVNNKKEGSKKSKPHTFFRTFDRNADLNSIQNDLIREIFQQTTEAVFNDAFTDW